ncbi:glycosyltransferase family 4 protein [Sphingobacterium sp. HJSM2_6]|uniref:glycosyltransferase family 4 protein n=1 Tax=Sphingobacterium sp. HJSM2_6 TaxID=3366264 RepID=UPI003BD02E16
MKKVIRTSTVPISLDVLLKGQLKYIKNEFEVIALSSPGIQLDNVGKREGVRTKSISIKRKISIYNDIVSLFKLIYFFIKEKPHIVHSITPKAGLLSMIAAFITGCPYRIHTFTGLIFPYKTGFQQKILILMDRILCLCATHIYPEGEGVKQDLLKFKITNKNLKILGNGNVNGVDLNYFNSSEVQGVDELRNILKIDLDSFVYVYVGRIVKDKGICDLVSAFLEISKLQTNCKLIIVGDYESSDLIDIETRNSINNNSSILHVGFIEDIRPYLKLANVHILPSYREGFPNVVLQAGAMSKPSIVTNISGSNEIIQNGYNGLIIDSKSVQDLFEVMEYVLLNKHILNNMGINARKNIEAKYGNDILWKAILDEYNSYFK